jgi:hypothetical protein
MSDSRASRLTHRSGFVRVAASVMTADTNRMGTTTRQKNPMASPANAVATDPR